ncbi:MAG: hypothetical protein WAX89_00860 [Alphaproteobacteria bacterium]
MKLNFSGMKVPNVEKSTVIFGVLGSMMAYGVFTVSGHISSKIATWFGMPADQAIGITSFIFGLIGLIVYGVLRFFSNLSVELMWDINKKKKAQDFQKGFLWFFVSNELLMICLSVFVKLKFDTPFGYAVLILALAIPAVCGVVMVNVPSYLGKMAVTNFKKTDMPREQIIRLATIAVVGSLGYGVIGVFVIVDLVHDALKLLTSFSDNTITALSWFMLIATFILSLTGQGNIEISESLGLYKDAPAKANVPATPSGQGKSNVQPLSKPVVSAI